MRALSLAQAVAIIEATFAKAAEMKLRPLAAMVLDAGGRPKVFMKQDGASLMRYEIAYGKAFAALAMGRSSRMCCRNRARSRSSSTTSSSSPTARCSWKAAAS